MAAASRQKAKITRKVKPPLFRVGRARTGLGLFAVQDIPERKLVIEYTGRRIPTKLAQEIDRRRANKYLFEIDSRWTIDGSVRSNLARYANHSCDPNTEAESNRGRLMYRAIKPIAEGDEITLDYGEEHMELYFGKAGCLCPPCVDIAKKDVAKSATKKKKRKTSKAAAHSRLNVGD
ncbi:MAG: SET domain-containing protein [Pseudolabrys sp.]|nr:SET domain-containing protein [Pseudolabrys sp.]MDP2298738.1 SET domain-containing protein [Pseudolabrys sp.]